MIAPFEISLSTIHHLAVESKAIPSFKADMLNAIQLVMSSLPNFEAGDIIISGFVHADRIPHTDVPYGETTARFCDEYFEIWSTKIDEVYAYDENKKLHCVEVDSFLAKQLVDIETMLSDYFQEPSNLKSLRFEEELVDEP